MEIYDTFINIIEFLDPKSLINLMLTQKNYLYSLGQSNIWLSFCENKFNINENYKKKVQDLLLTNLVAENINIRDYYDEYYYFYRIQKMEFRKYLYFNELLINAEQNIDLSKFSRFIFIKKYEKLLEKISKCRHLNINEHKNILNKIVFNLSDASNHLIIDTCVSGKSYLETEMESKIRYYSNSKLFYLPILINENDYVWINYHDFDTINSNCDNSGCKCENKKFSQFFINIIEKINEKIESEQLYQIVKFILTNLDD